jgi:hypothetical protein
MIESHNTSIETWNEHASFSQMVTMFDFIEHPLYPLCSLQSAVAVDRMSPGGLLAILTPNGAAGDRQLFPSSNDWMSFRVDFEHHAISSC